MALVAARQDEQHKQPEQQQQQQQRPSQHWEPASRLAAVAPVDVAALQPSAAQLQRSTSLQSKQQHAVPNEGLPQGSFLPHCLRKQQQSSSPLPQAADCRSNAPSSVDAAQTMALLVTSASQLQAGTEQT
jgi:hypothetical protein